MVCCCENNTSSSSGCMMTRALSSSPSSLCGACLVGGRTFIYCRKNVSRVWLEFFFVVFYYCFVAAKSYCSFPNNKLYFIRTKYLFSDSCRAKPPLHSSGGRHERIIAGEGELRCRGRTDSRAFRSCNTYLALAVSI